jgi:cytochrome oxidase Cu insertion factor (SCO1/SenC/PrrC family)
VIPTRDGVLRGVALLVLVVGTVILPVAAAERTAPLAVGDVAPDFTLVDQHGQRLHLADLLQTRAFVVVAFYVKAFTGG